MVSWDSFRYPSSGAVSSPASAPRLDSITHTCKPLTRRHHICTHKAIPLRRRPRQLRRHRLRRTAALGGGSATAATARLRRNRQRRRRRRNRQRRQNRWRLRSLLLRRKSAAVTLRRRLRCRRLQPLQRCAAVRILTASNAPALRMPLLCHGHSRRRRWDIRLRGANTCANCRGSW
jgi:hypothetical protein